MRKDEDMLTRRAFVTAAAASAIAQAGPAITQALAQAPAKVSKPVLGDDGLYHFDWYMESFLDLAEDIATAAEKKRRLALVWTQKGCIYCKRMAQEHFVDPHIAGYVRANFDVIHMNLFGSKEITDFDGRKYSEKAYARAYGIRLTPTIQFFPDNAAGLGAKAPMKREVARMPGLLEPKQFLAMFRFVREKGYEKSSFNDWLKKT